MRYLPYPEYLGATCSDEVGIPSGWEIRRLKFAASCNDEALPETTDPDYEIAYVDISSVDLINGITATEVLNFEEAPSRARRIVRDGDTIISTVRTYLKAIASIVSPPENMIVSTGFAVIRPSSFIDSRFLGYALQNSAFVEGVVACSTGVSYPAINPSALIGLSVAYPTEKAEQQHIADFLDWKTGQIDALIAKKQALVEKLKEKRLAVITQAVTKGLNAQAPLRPSSLPWVEQIPTHWRSGNIRRFATMRTGHTPSRSEPSYWIDCDIDWFTLADVWQLRDGKAIYLGETKEKISTFGLANSAAELLPAGTVVLSRTASVGFSGVMRKPMATSQDYWNWVPEDDLLSEYLLFLLRAMEQEFKRLTMGSTHKTIYQADAASLAICVPPIDEQRAIVAFIIENLEKLDRMIAQVGQVLSYLSEYRTALITAATTGQIDVRNVKIPVHA